MRDMILEIADIWQMSENPILKFLQIADIWQMSENPILKFLQIADIWQMSENPLKTPYSHDPSNNRHSIRLKIIKPHTPIPSYSRHYS